jgi:thioredoxin 1
MKRSSKALAWIAVLTLLGATTAAATGAERPQIVPLSPEQLSNVIGGGTWLIVEFGGEYCIPCMKMQPVLQDLQVALGKKARIHNFWIQQHPEVARQHRIMAMPTQVIFNPKGEEVYRHMGYFAPDAFHAELTRLGLL